MTEIDKFNEKMEKGDLRAKDFRKIFKNMLNKKDESPTCFVIYDGYDNHNVKQLYFNKYDSGIDVDLTLEDGFSINENKYILKELEEISKSLNDLDIGTAKQKVNELKQIWE